MKINNQRVLAFAFAAGLAVWAFAGRGASLDQVAGALNGAQSLRATVVSTPVGGGTGKEYRVTLSKPNLVRIDSNAQTVVADGKNVTVYDKASKTYVVDPQTEGTPAKLIAENDDLMMFAPFFNRGAFKDLKTTGSGSKKRKGMDLSTIDVNVDPSGKKKATLYVDGASAPQQMEVVFEDSQQRILVDADGLTLGAAPIESDKFAFSAPEGARLLTAEERMSDRWFDNVEEALKVAAKTNRMVLLKFGATWCGPCQMLKKEVFANAEFKKQSKNFVFVDIDTDHQPAVAQKYGVSGIPDVKFLKSTGEVVHSFVGYRPYDQVIAEMNKALKMAK